MDTSLRNRFMPKVQSITLSFAKESRVNPSRSSSGSMNRIKLNQNYSYYKNKEQIDCNSSMTKSQIVNEENCRFEWLQKKGKFIDYSEFDIIQVGEQIVAVSYFYPENYPEQLKEKFDQRIQEVKVNIQRRYPFIQLLLKPLAQSAYTSYGQDLPIKPLFEVQLCSYILNQSIQKKIISSMELTGEIPKINQIINYIQKTLRNVDLVVEIDCPLKDVQIIGPNQDNKQILEGLEVTLRQKVNSTLPAKMYKDGKLDTSKINDTSFDSKFISKINLPSSESLSLNTSLCRSTRSINIPRSTKSITFNQRSAKKSSTTISQTSFMMKTGLSFQGRSRSNSKVESSLNQTTLSFKEACASPLMKNQPIKVFSTKSVTNNSGIAYLKNIPLDMDEYYLEIQGSRELKQFKQVISLNQLYEQQRDGTLRVCYDLEREDLCSGNIQVQQNKGKINDASVKIGNYEFWKSEISPLNQDRKLWFQQIECDNEQNSYSFFSFPGSYYIEVSKSGCYPERKQMHFKKGAFDLAINLTCSTLVNIIMRTKNLITQQLVGDFQLRVVDQQENELWRQKTDESGITSITISLMKKIRVYVEKENYVNLYQDILLSADMIEHDIFVIPQNENVRNRLDILIHEPHDEFKINYQLICPGFNPVNQYNASNMVYGASFDQIKFKNGGKLIGISIQQLNGKNFELEAFSTLQKPNVKENFSKQMHQTMNSKQLNQPKLGADENDINYLDLYSRTYIYTDSVKQQKYEEHQKVGRNFCKAVQSVNGYFLNQRLSKTPLQFQQNLKEYIYVNEHLQKYTPEKSTKIYIVYDNQLVNVSHVSQNVLTEKKQIGCFDFNSKQFIDKVQMNFFSKETYLEQREELQEVLEQQQPQKKQQSINKGNYLKRLNSSFQQESLKEKDILKEIKQSKIQGINSQYTRQQKTIVNKRY